MTAKVLLKDLQEQIERGQVVVIVGAGVSIGATNGDRVASWIGLLESGVSRCRDVALPQLTDDWKDLVLSELRSGDLDNLLAVATKVSSKLNAPEGGEYRRWLRETVGSLRPHNLEVIDALHGLGLQIATTNYDGLIEEVTGLPAVTWMDGSKVERVIRGEDKGVLHLHGHWESPESVILGLHSYEQVMSNAHAQTVLRALQTMKTLLFIGFGAGLKDPNFGRFLQWTATVFRQSEYRRFRLAKEDEAEDLQKEHPEEERLFVLSFGKENSALAPFLASLRPSSSPSATLPVQECKWAIIPPPSPCFGRESEVYELVQSLLTGNPQQIPILGPPGIGKTTISIAALHDRRVIDRYGERRCFIRCDGIKTNEALVSELGLALGLQPVPQIATAVLSVLGTSRAVLVIDNAETPWEADTLRVEEFLGQIARIPSVALVVSVRGNERPSLPTWRESIQPHSLSRQAASDTFLAIAGEKHNADVHLEKILAALDYVPLAVTLMAHAAEAEPNLDGIWERWQQERTEMLKRAGGMERLTNLELSYEISIGASRMTDEARHLLGLLAHLPNGIALEELGHIFPSDSNRAASALRKTGLAFDESGRLRVLAPLREYVLRKHPPTEEDLKRLVGFYADVTVAEGSKVGREGGSAAIARIASQAANIEEAILQGIQLSDPGPALKAALDFANFTKLTGLASTELFEEAAYFAKTLGKEETAAHLIKSLAEIWFARSEYDTARVHFEEALSLYRKLAYVRGEANCILGIGEIALARSQHSDAQARFEEALSLYRKVPDVLGEANCIFNLGNIALALSQHDIAQARFKEALPLYQESTFVLGVANCTSALGSIALARSQHEIARAHFEEALSLCREVGSVRGEANCIFNLGNIAFARSQHGDAQRRFEEALPLYRQSGYVVGEANCVFCLGQIAFERSQLDDAQVRFEEAQSIYQSMGDVLGGANCILILGDIALRRSKLDDARTRFEQARPLFEGIGNVIGKANCLKGLGEIAVQLSLFDDARPQFEEALVLYRQVGELRGEANCIFNLGRVARYLSQYNDARNHFEEARPLYQKMGYVVGEANCLKSLGDIALELSSFQDARTRFDEALPLYQQVGDPLGQANCILGLGEVALRLSLYAEARIRIDEALALYRQVGDPRGEANCFFNLGNIAREQSDAVLAVTNYEKALLLYHQAWDRRGEANCMKNLAFTALSRNDRDAAKKFFRDALEIYQEISELYSAGMTHRALAHLASDVDERNSHVLAAGVAWKKIGHYDLIAELRSEFPDVSD